MAHVCYYSLSSDSLPNVYFLGFKRMIGYHVYEQEQNFIFAQESNWNINMTSNPNQLQSNMPGLRRAEAKWIHETSAPWCGWLIPARAIHAYGDGHLFVTLREAFVFGLFVAKD